MSQSEHRTEPHVSGQELRAALAPRGPSRPSPVVSQVLSERPPAEPAWEWTTGSDADLAELEELRAQLADREAELDRLRREARTARTAEKAARAGLRRVAEARPWRRGRVLADLTAQGAL